MADTTILIVDDDPTNLAILQHILQPYFRVLACNSGEAVLRAFDKIPKRPDLILLDVNMADMDGYTLLVRLRENQANRDIPVIFVTCRNEEQDEERGLALGAVDYLVKPIRPAILLARVRLHLERKQAVEALRASQTDLRTAHSIAHLGSWRLDIGKETLTWSDETYRIFGIPAEAPVTLQSFLACIHPDDRDKVHKARNASLEGTADDIEYRAVVGGEIKWVRERAAIRFDAGGRPLFVQGVVQDITGRKRDEEQLRIAAVAFEAHSGIMVTDAATVILQVNKSFTELTGYSAAEAVGKTPAILRSDRHNAAFYRNIYEALAHEGRWEGRIWNRRKDGNVFLEWLAISVVRDPLGSVTHYVGTFSDVIEPREAERKIVALALYDPLTSLPNRRLLYDRLQQAQTVGSRSGSFGALLFMDLDHFKKLNETRGHGTGDRLLVEMAIRLRSLLRGSDTAARLGGDEFVLLLENLGPQQAAACVAESVAEKLRAAVKQPVALNGDICRMTSSVGIKLFCGQEEDLETLFKHADLALYRAKDAGRDRICFYDQAMQTAVDQRVALETGLHRALEQGEMLLLYQPQIAATGRPVGAEALVRWQPQGQGMISPADFIPVAEETGLIIPIGNWVLETACRQLAIWALDPATRGLHVSVNISAPQFHQPDFVVQVRTVLQESGADPSCLKLELTESLLLNSVDIVVDRMKELKELGVKFSIDDFGTGYSSLSYLKRLPLDQLKIDQSFVRDIPADYDACVIAQAIVALGQSLRLEVIAEGVETETQRDFLASHGCHAYQGYFFARPGTASTVEMLARNWAERNSLAENQPD
ncbi:MAG: two-component system response regulator [Gammaproteobacteria bacterium]